MKKIYCLLILLTSLNVYAQSEAELFKKANLNNKELQKTELKKQFLNYDFSKLWTEFDNQYVYGFIGDNYQRIRIKLTSVTKSKTLPDTYDVHGKSMVKSNIDEFRGTIKISNIRRFTKQSLGVDDEFKNNGFKGDFVIIGDYNFSENKNQAHSGVFKGTFQTKFYLDKNSKIHYDDLNMGDSYTNNQFVGVWQEYNSKNYKRCNWADYRMPNSGDFDIGAGEFSPDDKYLKYGWQSVRDSYESGIKGKNAKKVEAAKWWL